MKLMTKILEKRFSQVGSQAEEKDPLIIAKFFNPCGAGTWYATEYDPETRTFFGYVSIFGDWNDEWGASPWRSWRATKDRLGSGLRATCTLASDEPAR